MEIKIRRLVALGLLILLYTCFYSCKKDDQSAISLPVVQAYLFAGHPITVRLYQQKSLTDTAKYGAPITGQKLYISDGSNRVSLTETAKGVYTYADSTFLVTGKTYSLSFQYLNKPVSAQTLVPQKALHFATRYGVVNYVNGTAPAQKPDTLNSFTWDNPDSLNHVIVFNDPDGNIFPLAGGGRSFGQQSVSNAFEYDTQRSSVFYVVSNSFPYYGNYQVVLLSVNKEYIDLLKSNTIGANSQNLFNTPTNVVNGIGIFTALQADTLSFSINNN
jgi:uncharacterized protein DUF4249